MTGYELHLIRYTFPLKMLLPFKFSTSIITKVNEFIQRSRSTVKCRKISWMDQINAAFDSIWLETILKDKIHFPVKLYPHTLSAVQSIESRVNGHVKCETTLEKDHYQSFIDFIH